MNSTEDYSNDGAPLKGHKTARRLDPRDIQLPPGYKIEVFKAGLTTPINLVIAHDDQMYVADAGVTSGSGKVIRLTPQGEDVVAEGFNPPLTGINIYKGDIFVSHRGFITVIKPNGKLIDVLAGLPSWGDHHNNRVVFGSDGKMYFGQGTATNSGVVGEDNAGWVENHPQFHDYPGASVVLEGRNFTSENFLTSAPGDLATTGAYSPFGVSTSRGECIKGITAASGSVLRANRDGSGLELIAWGLRNPFRMKFDRHGRLFSTNHGMDVRGSRGVANSPDEFQLIKEGVWYGWPDFTGGQPVTNRIFKPHNGPQPQFLLARHPMRPPLPVAVFAPHSAIMGFDFNYTHRFENFGDVYIAEFGSEAPGTTGGEPLPGVGHRVSRINMKNGKVSTFAINKSGFAASYTGGGGFERPIDVVFGRDESMYVVDFGISGDGEEGYLEGTGVIWRIRAV
ncbi:MAG: PQQ-dependent sugar dehydrogenase [Syntrophomonadales bacterium]|jgi:glucose/arabinose dehydrogenase